MYRNGSFSRTNKKQSTDFVQQKSEMFVVQNEGIPFRGKPSDMANDALSHIITWTSHEIVGLPVIYEEESGIDNYGNFTDKVVFQAVI